MKWLALWIVFVLADAMCFTSIPFQWRAQHRQFVYYMPGGGFIARSDYLNKVDCK